MRRLCQAIGIAVLCLFFGAGLGAELAQASPGVTYGGKAPVSPNEISPEGVRALVESRQAFLLVDADTAPPLPGGKDGDIRRIYYTRGPSVRAALELMYRDRQVGNASGAVSQRLVGTPLDWQRASLPITPNPLPSRPLQMSPAQFAEAVKDGVDFQVVDLRSSGPGNPGPSLPKSVRLMPHELVGKPAALSKERWIVLVDGNGQTAPPIAEQLFHQGYPLVAVLVGGYSAWAQFTGR